MGASSTGGAVRTRGCSALRCKLAAAVSLSLHECALQVDVTISAEAAKWSPTPPLVLRSCRALYCAFVRLCAVRPVASDLILDMQERSSHYLTEVATDRRECALSAAAATVSCLLQACTTISDSFASLAKSDLDAIRDALA